VQDARFVPPPVPQMLEALDDFEKYLHASDVYPPLVRLAVLHYQFETIHPFRDGNGRIGRLLISLLLVEWNLLPSPLLYLSDYFERHRQDYCDHLFAVSQRGTWREWILFFARGVAEQAKDASRRAIRLQELQSLWRRQLTEMRAPSPLLRLADSLFEVPVLTIPQAQETLRVNAYNTAKSNVEKLLQAGILHRLGSGAYDKVYVAKAILGIVSGDAVPPDAAR
jgi:Fic family protein